MEKTIKDFIKISEDVSVLPLNTRKDNESEDLVLSLNEWAFCVKCIYLEETEIFARCKKKLMPTTNLNNTISCINFTKKEEKDSATEHPKHYNSHPSGIECIEIAQHHNFNVGNVLKYIWRAGLKESEQKDLITATIEDLEKAKIYIEFEIKRLKNTKN